MVEDLSFLDDCRKPRLFVQGSDDQFGSGERLEAIVSRLPEPRSVVVVPKSDHFFTGRLDELQGALDSWLVTLPWTAA
jgi:alpha/beta superfamily hydrolase